MPAFGALQKGESMKPDEALYQENQRLQRENAELADQVLTLLEIITEDTLCKIVIQARIEERERCAEIADQYAADALEKGEQYQINAMVANHLARLHPDGTLDVTFIPNPLLKDNVNALALQPDGKIVTVGARSTVWPGIARYLADGKSDAGFRPPAANMNLAAVGLQADGKVIVAGLFDRLGEQPRTYIARLNADGALDAAFNPALDGWALALAVQPDNKVLVGGAFMTLDGHLSPRIARLNADGSPDLAFP